MFGIFSHLRVVASRVVQQGVADVVEASDLTRVVAETLKGAAADVPGTYQTILDLR